VVSRGGLFPSFGSLNLCRYPPFFTPFYPHPPPSTSTTRPWQWQRGGPSLRPVLSPFHPPAGARFMRLSPVRLFTPGGTGSLEPHSIRILKSGARWIIIPLFPLPLPHHADAQGDGRFTSFLCGPPTLVWIFVWVEFIFSCIFFAFPAAFWAGRCAAGCATALFCPFF